MNNQNKMQIMFKVGLHLKIAYESILYFGRESVSRKSEDLDSYSWKQN